MNPAQDTPVRVFIVDDEEPARMRLASLIAGMSAGLSARVVGEAANAGAALAWLNRNVCDVVLLDIAMPGLDGMALAARLREQSSWAEAAPQVVFVTAHAEHALRAFEVEALDYLTKPVRRERLQAALERAAQRLGAQRRPHGQPASPAEPADGAVISVMDRGALLRVPLVEVLYLKAEMKYVGVRTATHLHLLDASLADLEQRWPDRFVRIHRNALVAIHAIRALERVEGLAGARDAGDELGPETGPTWAVRVALVDECLAVSRRQLPGVREALRLAGRHAV
jgi:two-component system, LytTR family, response regulator AlgR